MVNPLKGRRAKPMWRLDEAVSALKATLRELEAPELFRASGVLRPARSAEQVEHFQKAANLFPAHGEWLPPEMAHATYPDVQSPLGALFVKTGGVIFMPDLIRAALGKSKRNGTTVQLHSHVTGWTPSQEGVEIETSTNVIRSRKLILCVGAGFAAFPQLSELALHKIKGQAIVLERPPSTPIDLPAISAGPYIIPDGDHLHVGATFEHHFSDLNPDHTQTLQLKKRAAELLPSLAEASIVDARAGARVTVPGTRKPLLGPLPGSRNVWVFSGLGAKGLMTAPLLAKDLGAFLDKPEQIPDQIRPVR